MPVAKESSPSVSPTTLRKQKKETVGSSTTALIFENRPSYLPPKSVKEELKHRQQYEEMIAFAKKKELKDKDLEKKRQKERQKLENQISNIVKTWKEDVIPNWHNWYVCFCSYFINNPGLLYYTSLPRFLFALS